jgi:hypothetical protein
MAGQNPRHRIRALPVGLTLDFELPIQAAFNRRWRRSMG